LGVNECLLSMVNRISEKMYWECSVMISRILKASLQESLGRLLARILTIFFCTM
jgi:hypothetical protein